MPFLYKISSSLMKWDTLWHGKLQILFLAMVNSSSGLISLVVVRPKSLIGDRFLVTSQNVTGNPKRPTILFGPICGPRFNNGWRKPPIRLIIWRIAIFKAGIHDLEPYLWIYYGMFAWVRLTKFIGAWIPGLHHKLKIFRSNCCSELKFITELNGPHGTAFIWLPNKILIEIIYIGCWRTSTQNY